MIGGNGNTEGESGDLILVEGFHVMEPKFVADEDCGLGVPLPHPALRAGCTIQRQVNFGLVDI